MSGQLNILVFANFAGSPQHGMVLGHYYLAREWVRMGHQVTIIAASYAHTRFVQPLQAKKTREELIDGIRYIWIPTQAYKPEKWLARVMSILNYTWKTRWKSLPVKNADMVICSSHFPAPIYAAHRYAKRFGAKLVFEVRDLWPLTLVELGGASSKNPFIAWLQRAEDYAYKHADAVVSVLPGAKDYMVSRGMDPRKFEYIPNGVDTDILNQSVPLPDGHRAQLVEFKKDNAFVIGYAGRVGLANAMHVLVEALALLKDKSIGLAILGNGSHIPALKDLLSRLGLEKRVLFLSPVNKNQVADFLSHIDVAYLGLQNKPLFRFGVSPTKLNDFMLAAKPVISAVDVPHNITEISGAGFVCPPDDPAALSKIIEKAFHLDPKKLADMGKNGQQWVIANHNYKHLAQRYLQKVLADV